VEPKIVFKSTLNKYVRDLSIDNHPCGKITFSWAY
jgi:hypothetical protein